MPDLCQRYVGISIHALLAESDGKNGVYCDTDSVFLSTLSLRRATGFHKINCQMMVISIHALLAESDVYHIL